MKGKVQIRMLAKQCSRSYHNRKYDDSRAPYGTHSTALCKNKRHGPAFGMGRSYGIDSTIYIATNFYKFCSSACRIIPIVCSNSSNLKHSILEFMHKIVYGKLPFLFKETGSQTECAIQPLFYSNTDNL